MNESTTGTSPVITKRLRNPAQQWVRFWSLKTDELFYVGRFTAKKTGLFSYTILNGPNPAPGSMLPWTKVRSQRPVKAAK